MMGSRDHGFVRSADPNFGAAFGGGCAHDDDGVTCGWPESAHPASASVEPPAPEDLMGEITALHNDVYHQGRNCPEGDLWECAERSAREPG